MRHVWTLALLGSLAACERGASPGDGSNGDSGTGAAETSLAGTSTADVPTSAADSVASTGVADDTGTPSGPTYAEDVAPILAAHCWSCHVEGGFGPFSLVDYDDVRPLGPAVVGITAERQMPPWPLDGTGACQSFVDTRWLSDDELATLAAWVDAGSQPGDLTQLPDQPTPPVLGAITSTVAVPTYTPVAEPPEHPFDDYRCFVVDPGLPEGGLLSAFEVHPGVIEQAHHIVLFSLDSDDAVTQALALTDEDAAPGYRCFGAAGVNESRILGAWTPGVPVVRFPEGTGVEIPAARPIIVQMHYNLTGGAQPDDTTIDLQIDNGVTPLQSLIFVDTDLSIPAGAADHVEESFTTVDGSGEADLVAVFPHMHQIGRTLQVEITSADGTTCAVDVPRYDFHWQELYRYVTPVRVHGGDEVHLRCTFDATGRDQTTVWGEGSGDEMCAVQFYARPLP
jgi:Copper type II ascorbate-dependent monooxygenase, C-terminal domain